MLIERLMRVALFGSEWVLYLLLGLSVVSISTMVERFLYFRKRSDDLGKLRLALLQRLDDDDLEGARTLLANSRSVEAAVARQALHWAPSGASAMEDAVDSELARVKSDLERGLTFLGTLGNNAPFVGLFGTVLGVIIAFRALGEAGGNAGQMGGVMAGIAEALVATGVGLFVALPAVVAYNVIQKRIGEIESGAVSLSKLITAHVKSTRGHYAEPLAETSDDDLAAAERDRSDAAAPVGDLA